MVIDRYQLRVSLKVTEKELIKILEQKGFKNSWTSQSPFRWNTITEVYVYQKSNGRSDVEKAFSELRASGEISSYAIDRVIYNYNRSSEPVSKTMGYTN